MSSYESLHLDKGEDVIMEVRKHWIVFFGHAFSMFMAAIFPCVIFVVIKILFPGIIQSIRIPSDLNISALLLFFYTLWLLFLWASFFLQWTKYYLDVWFVTPKRIISVSQKNIFDREISNLRFDKIQDVTIDVHGFIPTILNFGTIKVQTAGEDNQDFIMHTVRRPDKVRQVIFSQHNEIGDTPTRYAKENLETEKEELARKI